MINLRSLTYSLRHSSRLLLLLRAGGGILLFAGASCRPVDRTARARKAEYIPPPPQPARASTRGDAAMWLDAWESVRREIGKLSAELEAEQTLYTGYPFDEFLRIDPATLEDDQLACLLEFLRRGYFRVEREALVAWLERRSQHLLTASPDPDVTGRGAISQRIQSAMRSDELMLVDLEAAIGVYRKADRSAFEVAESLTDDERSQMLAEVIRLRNSELTAIAGLDRRIQALQGEVPSR